MAPVALSCFSAENHDQQLFSGDQVDSYLCSVDSTEGRPRPSCSFQHIAAVHNLYMEQMRLAFGRFEVPIELLGLDIGLSPILVLVPS